MATHLDYAVLAELDDEVIATYVDVLHEANEQTKKGGRRGRR